MTTSPTPSTTAPSTAAPSTAAPSTAIGATAAAHRTSPAAGGLVARTVALPPAVAAGLDLLAFAGEDGTVFVREGAGFAARGVAARISLDRGMASVAAVAEALDAIAAEDALGGPGTGPVAFGALAFDPGHRSTLLVPEVLVGRAADGTAWCTTVGPAGSPPPDAIALATTTGPVEERRSPHDFDLHAVTPHEAWLERVAEAVRRIRAGELSKVVLARAVDVRTPTPLVVAHVLRRLRALHPSCMVFSVDGFVGASPELLVGRAGDVVQAHPLAGTVARSGDPDTDARLGAALLASTKDRWEHALVVDAIAAALAPICPELDVPDEPSLVPLRNVSHLGTHITGRLPAAGPAPSALDLAAVLHPTPAVGGTPTAKAVAMIAELEPHPRGRYAGPVGWVDAAGNGEWAVGIRSADIQGNRARMMAGVGIVADSDPEEELAETQLKLQALLAAVVRP